MLFPHSTDSFIKLPALHYIDGFIAIPFYPRVARSQLRLNWQGGASELAPRV